jgi:hypothetical protein
MLPWRLLPLHHPRLLQLRAHLCPVWLLLQHWAALLLQLCRVLQHPCCCQWAWQLLCHHLQIQPRQESHYHQTLQRPLHLQTQALLLQRPQTLQHPLLHQSQLLLQCWPASQTPPSALALVQTPCPCLLHRSQGLQEQRQRDRQLLLLPLLVLLLVHQRCCLLEVRPQSQQLQEHHTRSLCQQHVGSLRFSAATRWACIHM